MKKTLIELSKLIGAIATIATAALWFDAKFDAAIESSDDNSQVVMDSIAALREDVHYINVEQSFMAQDIEALHDTLEDMNDNIQQNTAINERLIWIEQNRSDFNPHQIELILDEYLKKNECSVSGKILFPYRHEQNIYDNYTLIENQKSPLIQ